jgi:cytochrome c-type biogenesis protein CcmE
VPRTKSPARLVIALSVAGVLAIFLVYVAIAGGTPQVKPSNVAEHKGSVVLVGTVVSGSIQPAANDGKRFQLRDRDGTARFPVVYRDAPPDQFKGGREISLTGTVRNGVFVGRPGTMLTKCPSKYQAAKKAA